ncbi:hypothetical protein CerSpe_184820 [Prunus speciosa]
MQHLLRIFNMGGYGYGHASISVNVTEENYPYLFLSMTAAYIPTPSPVNYSIDDDRSPSSGKAVVGWLKLSRQAALRWGVFIRKKAVERRAQLVQLDDS